MSTITETLKAKLDELDLDRRLDELTVATEKAVKRAVEQAGELAHDNRDKVSALLDKAGAALDQRTEGRYAAQFGKVREQVVVGVDKLAAKRPAHPHTSGAAQTPRPESTHEEPAVTIEHTATPQDAPTTWGEHTDGI